MTSASRSSASARSPERSTVSHAARSTCSSSEIDAARVVELGEVVRDVRDVAHRVVAPLPQPHLEHGLGAGRDPQLAPPPALPGQQVGVVGVLGDRDRPGVRHRHRHRAQRHDAVDAEPLHHRPHAAAERLPADVGLRAVQQQVRRAAGVVAEPDHQPGRLVARVVVAHERHRGPPRAVVVELVHVEGGDDPGVGEVDEVLGGAGRRVAGVEEAVEHQDHRQPLEALELGHVVDDVDQGRLGHDSSSSTTAILRCSAPAHPAPGRRRLTRPRAPRRGGRRSRSNRPRSPARGGAAGAGRGSS